MTEQSDKSTEVDDKATPIASINFRPDTYDNYNWGHFGTYLKNHSKDEKTTEAQRDALVKACELMEQFNLHSGGRRRDISRAELNTLARGEAVAKEMGLTSWEHAIVNCIDVPIGSPLTGAAASKQRERLQVAYKNAVGQGISIA